MASVTELRKEIISAITRGEPTDKLEKELTSARIAEQTAKEVAELRAVADKRKEFEASATRIELRASNQGKAIESFLELRDTITGPLAELVTQAKALILAQEACYKNFNDSFVFGGSIRLIPQGFLPEGFSCPRLDMRGGEVPSYEKAKEAIQYLMWALGILQAFEVGKMIAAPSAQVKEALVVPSTQPRARKVEPKSPTRSANETFFQG